MTQIMFWSCDLLFAIVINNLWKNQKQPHHQNNTYFLSILFFLCKEGKYWKVLYNFERERVCVCVCVCVCVLEPMYNFNPYYLHISYITYTKVTQENMVTSSWNLAQDWGMHQNIFLAWSPKTCSRDFLLVLYIPTPSSLGSLCHGPHVTMS